MKRNQKRRPNRNQMISDLKNKLKKEQDPIERENIQQRLHHWMHWNPESKKDQED
jgi:hypothetical protein